MKHFDFDNQNLIDSIQNLNQQTQVEISNILGSLDNNFNSIKSLLNDDNKQLIDDIVLYVQNYIDMTDNISTQEIKNNEYENKIKSLPLENKYYESRNNLIKQRIFEKVNMIKELENCTKKNLEIFPLKDRINTNYVLPPTKENIMLLNKNKCIDLKHIFSNKYWKFIRETPTKLNNQFLLNKSNLIDSAIIDSQKKLNNIKNKNIVKKNKEEICDESSEIYEDSLSDYDNCYSSSLEDENSNLSSKENIESDGSRNIVFISNNSNDDFDNMEEYIDKNKNENHDYSYYSELYKQIKKNNSNYENKLKDTINKCKQCSREIQNIQRILRNLNDTAPDFYKKKCKVNIDSIVKKYSINNEIQDVKEKDEIKSDDNKVKNPNFHMLRYEKNMGKSENKDKQLQIENEINDYIKTLKANTDENESNSNKDNNQNDSKDDISNDLNIHHDISSNEDD